MKVFRRQNRFQTVQAFKCASNGFFSPSVFFFFWRARRASRGPFAPELSHQSSPGVNMQKYTDPYIYIGSQLGKTAPVM